MITYEKGAAPTQKITLTNSVKTDLRGLGTGVGGFSNLATTMYAMMEQFDPEKQAEQRAELRHRIKLLREIVGQEIDRIKGTAAPIVPKEWKKREKILPEDTDAEKAEKYKHNSMVICKKPYFFRYLYPELNKQFKQYESSYNQMCLSTFGMKLKQLMAKPDKTDAEKKLLRLYQNYNPLITSNCIMNILCREFEDADFEINFRKDNVSMLPTFENEVTFDQEKMKIMKLQYQKYNSSKQINILNRFFDYDDNALISQKLNDFKNIKFKIADSVCFDIRETLNQAKITPTEVLFYAHELSQLYKKFNWAFVWDILDNQILNFIPQGTTNAPINIKDLEDGIVDDADRYNGGEVVEYLGQYYVLKDVTKDKWAKQIVEAPEPEDFSQENEVEMKNTDGPSVNEKANEETLEPEEEFMTEQELRELEDTLRDSALQDKQDEINNNARQTEDDDWCQYNDDVPPETLSSFGDSTTDWWDQYLNQIENSDDNYRANKRREKRKNDAKHKNKNKNKRGRYEDDDEDEWN